MPQIYLQDITSKIPLLSLIIVFFFIFSMENKTYWFLLLPLGLCLIGIYFTQQQLWMYQNLIINMILLLNVMILGLSLFLDPDVETTSQVVLRGISIFLMSFVAVMIVLSSSTKNIYIEIFSILLIVISFICSFLWISINNQQLRSTFSLLITIIFVFFILQYMKNISIQKKRNSKKQQQVFSFGNMQIKPL